MTRFITVFLATLTFTSASYAAPNESRSGMPTDTGTSVDKLMLEDTKPRDEAPAPADEKKVKKVKTTPVEKTVAPSETSPDATHQ